MPDFGKAFDWIKSHPWIAVGAAALLVGGWWYFSHHNASSSGTVVPTPTGGVSSADLSPSDGGGGGSTTPNPTGSPTPGSSGGFGSVLSGIETDLAGISSLIQSEITTQQNQPPPQVTVDVSSPTGGGGSGGSTPQGTATPTGNVTPQTVATAAQTALNNLPPTSTEVIAPTFNLGLGHASLLPPPTESLTELSTPGSELNTATAAALAGYTNPTTQTIAETALQQEGGGYTTKAGAIAAANAETPAQRHAQEVGNKALRQLAK